MRQPTEPASHLSQSGPPDWAGTVYRPIEHGAETLVIGHLAQSLDGFIAGHDGRSQWISGAEDLAHTHRLRSLVDAVIVGARTVELDDPQLNVRRVQGAHPLRVVLDPAGQLSAGLRVFRDGGPTLRVIAAGAAPCELDEAERGGAVQLEAPAGLFSPALVLAMLRRRGVGRVLVEGGGTTVSAFWAAGCVDRLHLVVCPVVLGRGVPGLRAPRPALRVEGYHGLGGDLLLDCVPA